MKILTLILIFLYVQVSAQTGQIEFEHFFEDDGLRTGPRQCIYQDRIGHLWFAGWGDLQKYDGYNFKSYGGLAFYSTMIEDKKGIFWIGTYRGLQKLDPVTEKFEYFIPNKSAGEREWSNHVLSILEDKEGILWIGTGNGLNTFNRQSLKFTPVFHDSSDATSLINNVINDIHEDHNGDLWFGTGNGLDKYNKQNKTFQHYFHNPQNKNDFGNWGNSSSWITCIYEDKDGIFWLGTFGGLIKFNPESNEFIHFDNHINNSNNPNGEKIFSICEDKSGKLWISTADNGVLVYDKKLNSFLRYKYTEGNPEGLSSNYTFSILIEKSGTIWISTLNGLNKINRTQQLFKKIIHDNVQQLFPDKNGKIYIVLKDALKVYNSNTEELYEIKNKGTLIFIDSEGSFWYNEQEGGLYKVDASGRRTNFYSSSDEEFNMYVSFVYKTRDNRIWIGTNNYGLYIIEPGSSNLSQINNTKFFINVIYEDKYGLVWVGTANVGLFCYKDRKLVNQFSFEPGKPDKIQFSTVLDIHESSDGMLWIAGKNGLFKYMRNSGKFAGILTNKETTGFNSSSILEDNNGNLWISGPGGITKYNIKNSTQKTYDISYGLIKNGFNPRSKYKSSNGEMYFGGPNGLLKFHPDSIKDNLYIPGIVINSFKVFNEEIKLDSVIWLKKRIQLPYYNNALSFEFSALNFVSQKRNQYAYLLEGVDRDWVFTGARRYASYPNLEPGEYTFRVKASNNDGIWNEEGTSIAIIISPPWWKTWWAYILYFGLLLAGLYILRRYELNREALKNTIKMDEAILKEREETDRMKSRFFANISHEFRTPLTLILGPAEKIISGTSEDVSKEAKVIKRNSPRLLQLINQLLDLSKLEAGKLKLEVSKGNIVSFVKGVTLSFESLSESKDITLKLISEKEYIELFFDREKMMKIITNILSNAFKFTPEEGKISVSVKETNHNTVEIKIKDSGIGIKASELPKLFDRFYQVDSSHTREYEGTGIGLALTKELVELQYGSIRVESIQNNGDNNWTEFTLEFPLGRDHLKDDDIISELKEGEEIGTMVEEYNPEEIRKNNLMQEDARIIKEEKTIVLVVEDNYDMREYIKDSLNKKEYQIEEAVNGEQGVRKAEKLIPDLIISDLMMPKMDGNELVKILKNNEKTSHIPIILLTAKAGLDDKLEGLETGADDYLTKPFDIKELQIRIRNLISIRKMLQVKFSKIGFTSAQEVKTETAPVKVLSSIDEKFMLKVKEVIEKHIAEEEFSIEDFGSEVGMSRMQLHRKLKALTGKSASHYIRSVKLEKAKKMIEDKKGNISEIAYSLGFNSPAYFTHCFKEEFGVPPSTIIS